VASVRKDLRVVIIDGFAASGKVKKLDISVIFLYKFYNTKVR
jgi:hypothetical protein